MKHMTKEMLNWTYPKQQKIFEPGFEYHTVTGISDIFVENNELCLETSLTTFQKGTIRLSIVDGIGIRFRYSQKFISENRFEEYIEDSVSYSKIDYKEDKEKIYFAFEDKQVNVFKKPFNITITDKDNNIIFTLNEDKNGGFEMFGDKTAPALGYKAVKDDELLPYISFKIRNDEKIFGLGEKFGPVLKNGTRSVIFNTDTSGKNGANLGYARIPYLLSSRNWGILFNTGVKTNFEIGSDVMDAISVLPEEEVIDAYIMIGNSLKDLIDRYTNLTGKIDGIPDYAYGMMLSRLYYYDEEQVEEIIETASQNKLPLDSIHIDPKWLKNRYTKSCNFVYADERFSKPTEFFSNMEDKGIKISFWFNPYIQGDDSENFKYLKENGLLVKSKNGGLAHAYTNVELYQTDLYIIDFTNPLAYKWWVDEITKLAKAGLTYALNDYGDGVPEDAIFYNGLDGKQMRQNFMYLYNKASHEAMEKVLGKGKVVNVSRPGYIGTQKYPGKWGGDSDSRWEDMKMSLQGGLSLAMNGETFWGTDIGGFLDKPEEELYVRWTQMGCFLPYSRLHGITPREPWMFGKEAQKNASIFWKLKRKMIPFYKMHEQESVEKGIPSLRHMVLNYQNDPIVSNIDDQYMIGDNMIVAPIFDKGVTSRKVYLPEGNWINYFTRKEYEGNKLHTIKVDLYSIPVFVKAGTIVPEFENGTYKMDKLGNQKLIVKVFMGEQTKGKKTFLLDDKKVTIKYDINKNGTNVVVKGWDKNEVVLIK